VPSRCVDTLRKVLSLTTVTFYSFEFLRREVRDYQDNTSVESGSNI
jgi:hypothetical protein